MLSILLSAFLLSLSSCVDNIVIGIAYGMKKTRITFIYNLIIAIITTTGTLLSMLFGRLIAAVIPVAVAQILGAAIIVLIGIYFILDYFIKKYKNQKKSNNNLTIINSPNCFNENQSMRCYRIIGLRETFMLALALTINNLGIGISASLAGVNIIATVIFTFILSLATIVLGVSMGYNVIGRMFGKYASLVSGLLMITLGIIEIFS